MAWARAIDWVELAEALFELGQLTGIDVSCSLYRVKDVMCCKVAGNVVEVTRKQLEERNFVGLYDALKAAMERAGIAQPERFLVQAPVRPPGASATEIAMRLEYERLQLEQQLAVTRRAVGDNQYRYLGLARSYDDEDRPIQEEPDRKQVASSATTGAGATRSVSWREPCATPELELGEPSEISKLDVLMGEPFSQPRKGEQAPDLILEPDENCQHGSGNGTSKKAAS